MGCLAGRIRGCERERRKQYCLNCLQAVMSEPNSAMKHKFDLHAARLTFTLIQPITTMNTTHRGHLMVCPEVCPSGWSCSGTRGGNWSIALKAVRQGAEVVGLDLSHTMLAKAAERRDVLPK